MKISIWKSHYIKEGLYIYQTIRYCIILLKKSESNENVRHELKIINK